jgi:rubredoxin
MSDTEFWECPNCGGTDFEEITSNRHRCVYCGTVLRSREGKSALLKCPRCGHENEPGDRYCNSCGAPLVHWALFGGQKIDLALISIVVTIVGSFVVPLVGAIVGLALAYKARVGARAGGEGSEKLARTAIIVGWAGVAYGVLPLCMLVGMPGTQLACSFCEEMQWALSDLLDGIGIGR